MPIADDGLAGTSACTRTPPMEMVARAAEPGPSALDKAAMHTVLGVGAPRAARPCPLACWLQPFRARRCSGAARPPRRRARGTRLGVRAL